MIRRVSSSAASSCGSHPMRAAVARCRTCDARLCNDCFRFRAAGDPCCPACAYTFETKRGGRLSLAISFFGLAAGAVFVAARRFDALDDEPFVLGLAAVSAVVIALGIWASGRPGKHATAPEVTVRDLDAEIEAEALDRAASPYRGRAQRMIAAASPRVSGKVTALVVGASLALSALLFPASVKLPRWVEAEGVIGLWWLVFAVTLGVLLYRGFKLRDDLVYFFPWNRPASSGAAEAVVDAVGGGGGAPARSSSRSAGCGDLGGCGDVGCGAVDGEAAVFVAVLAIAAAALFGAAWVVAELAMPVAIIVVYLVTLRALARVANDRHGCRGSIVRAAGFGALWATIYVAPLAIAALLVHLGAR